MSDRTMLLAIDHLVLRTQRARLTVRSSHPSLYGISIWHLILTPQSQARTWGANLISESDAPRAERPSPSELRHHPKTHRYLASHPDQTRRHHLAGILSLTSPCRPSAPTSADRRMPPQSQP